MRKLIDKLFGWFGYSRENTHIIVAYKQVCNDIGILVDKPMTGKAKRVRNKYLKLLKQSKVAQLQNRNGKAV